MASKIVRWSDLTLLACTAQGWAVAQGRFNYFLKRRDRPTVYQVGVGSEDDVLLKHSFDSGRVQDETINDVGQRLERAYGGLT